jgi:tetratricopeptide (TPR) repeat protein
MSSEDVEICVRTLYKHALRAPITDTEKQILLESVVIMSSDIKDNDAVNYCAAMAMAMLRRHDEAALERYDRVLVVQPRNVQILTKRSQCLLFMERYDDAVKDIEEVVRLCPGNVAAMLIHGVCMLLRNKTHDALADFRKVLEIDPSNADALLGNANCLFNMGQMFEAKAVYEKLLEVQPDNAFAKGRHAKCVLETLPSLEECNVASALLSLLNGV